MLDLALRFLSSELNSYLTARAGPTPDEVVALRQLVDDSGKWAVPQDRIGLALINVEEESVLRTQLPAFTYVDGRQVLTEPELKVNLHVLFAANFQQYDRALSYLSLVLTFFQAHRTFTHEQFPALDKRIDKLNVELQSLGYEQLNQIWAFIGGKQLPSVVYKVRLVLLQDVEPAAIRRPVTEIQATVEDR